MNLQRMVEEQIVARGVSDNRVLEEMLRSGAAVGGEQSGHIIFSDIAQTGDGLLTAVQLLNVVAGTGMELRQLRDEAITEFPQVLVNVKIDRGVDVSSLDDLWDEVALVEEELGEDGRVLVRPSGTEPLVRIMVEAPSQMLASGYAERLAAVTEMATTKE